MRKVGVLHISLETLVPERTGRVREHVFIRSFLSTLRAVAGSRALPHRLSLPSDVFIRFSLSRLSPYGHSSFFFSSLPIPPPLSLVFIRTGSEFEFAIGYHLESSGIAFGRITLDLEFTPSPEVALSE